MVPLFRKTLFRMLIAKIKSWADMGILLFDADGDKDNDMYIAAGSNEFEEGSPQYQDKLYINDGKGNFALDTSALPQKPY